jgi:hypothetical protein
MASTKIHSNSFLEENYHDTIGNTAVLAAWHLTKTPGKSDVVINNRLVWISSYISITSYIQQ